MNHETAYSLVKSAAPNYEALLKTEIESLDPMRIARVGEMVLVRIYDDWYMGDPSPNISKAIHSYCAELHRKAKRPLAWLRKLTAYLAWAYTTLDHDSDDAFLLVETLSSELQRDGDRLLPPNLRTEILNRLAQWRGDRAIPENTDSLDEYHREAWAEITRWEITPSTKWAAVSDGVDAIKEGIGEIVPDAVSKPIMAALEGALAGVRDIAGVGVRDAALLEEVQALGHNVKKIRDLRQMPSMEDLDKISASSMAGGKVLAGLEGAGTGAGGFMTIAADIPALLAIIFRYIQQIAHTYGFDTKAPEEQLFVLNILGLGSADQGAKSAFLRNLNQIAVGVAKNAGWKDLEKSALVLLIKKIAQAIGYKLTKRKLAQLIPIIGAAVGGGANYAYADDVLQAARQMYRKRWLINMCERANKKR